MIIKAKIAWEWLKKYWKAAALVVWTILIWLFSRKNADGAIEALKASKESSEKQIRELKKQHHIEIENHLHCGDAKDVKYHSERKGKEALRREQKNRNRHDQETHQKPSIQADMTQDRIDA